MSTPNELPPFTASLLIYNTMPTLSPHATQAEFEAWRLLHRTKQREREEEEEREAKDEEMSTPNETPPSTAPPSSVAPPPHPTPLPPSFFLSDEEVVLLPDSEYLERFHGACYMEEILSFPPVALKKLANIDKQSRGLSHLTAETNYTPEVCPICLEVMDGLGEVVGRCGHGLHMKCYKVLEKTRGGDMCPICRADITCLAFPSLGQKTKEERDEYDRLYWLNQQL